MCTTFWSYDVINVAVGLILISIIVLHSNLNVDIVLCTFAINNLIVKCFVSTVDILNKFLDTTFVVEAFLVWLITSFVCKSDAKSLCKERCLTKSYFKCLIIKNCSFKNCIIWKECYLCSCFFNRASTNFFKRIHCLSSFVSLLKDFSFTLDFYFNPI